LEIDTNEFKKKEIEFLNEKLSQPENHLREAFNHISKGWRKQIIMGISKNPTKLSVNFVS
jgi:DNA-binding HxlR family transcriptional regulator